MAKRKLQTGDKVRVKPDLKVDDNKFGFVFTKQMAELKGQTLTIKSWSWGSMTYSFEETELDISVYFLEKVDSAPAQLAPKFKVGGKVKFKQDLVVNKRYGQVTYLKYMDDDKDRIWTISSINAAGICTISYNSVDGRRSWLASKEMIEPYIEEQPKCCEGKIVNCTEPTPMKKELKLPKEALEEKVLPKEPSSLIARRKNRKIYYTADKPIC